MVKSGAKTAQCESSVFTLSIHITQAHPISHLVRQDYHKKFHSFYSPFLLIKAAPLLHKPPAPHPGSFLFHCATAEFLWDERSRLCHPLTHKNAQRHRERDRELIIMSSATMLQPYSHLSAPTCLCARADQYLSKQHNV